MPGFVPGILFGVAKEDRRDKPGDEEWVEAEEKCPYLANCLYLMRFGITLSSPRRRFLSSS
jgi:hypothetical protein